MLPIYITTPFRLANNLRLYEDAIAPHLVPSMGGFSITVFTLNALFQMFQKGRCWWTQSNNELPLIRYTGASLKLYPSESSDYIVNYHKCFPMRPTIETYNSTQPTIMQLSRKHKIIKCKKHNYRQKPYKKLRITPPAQLTNKWFFQKELADTPLFMLMATGMSLDRFFMASNAQSTTIGFRGLNPDLWKYHNFYQTTTSGYHPDNSLYFYSYQQSTPPQQYTKVTEIKIGNLIFLGNTNSNTPGTTIQDTDHSWKTAINTYFNDYGRWGNIFIPLYLTSPLTRIITSTSHPRDIITETNYSTKDTTLKEEHFKFLTKPLLRNYRYNPLQDTGINNKLYMVSITDFSYDWNPPRDLELQNNNLPQWIANWGFIDFMKLLKKDEIIDTQKLIVLQTRFINPQDPFIIPIDEDFLSGYSPFRKEITAADKLNWHPKVAFQYKSIAEICMSGPGTLKLPPNTSAEGHIHYTLYFKLGGCAEAIKTIDNPSLQPEFPIPGNLPQSTSLQSPETPIENYFYSFDWRRQFLTEKAAQRISKYQTPETSIIPPTGLNLFNPTIPHESSSEGETETPEEETQTLKQLLKLFRLRQQQYKQQILRLMSNIE